MPNRYIKDRARRSPSLDGLSDGAERLFWRLILTADDYGRFEADPRILLAECFPRRIEDLKSATVARQYAELEAGDDPIVRSYTVKGRRYGVFRKWDEKPRAKSSRFPVPPPDPWGEPVVLAPGEQVAASAEHVHADAEQPREPAAGTGTGTGYRLPIPVDDDGTKRDAPPSGASPTAALNGRGGVGGSNPALDPDLTAVLVECPHLRLVATGASAAFWESVFAACEPYPLADHRWLTAKIRSWDNWFRTNAGRQSTKREKLEQRLMKWLVDDLEKLARQGGA